MIIHSDCILALNELISESIQVDSIVTDPPYEIGFMGMAWDKSGIAFNVELWELCLKLLKPGGHLLAFGGAKTYHRVACAIEDAGFEIRDQIMWIYGSGFPKSLDISKAIDKAAGADREIVGSRPIAYADSDCWGIPNSNSNSGNINPTSYKVKGIAENGCRPITSPATDLARQWQGFGTALKPAHEPIVLARKPISEKTIAANVIKYGTGAINIDGCRVGQGSGETKQVEYPNIKGNNYSQGVKDYAEAGKVTYQVTDKGRFPANLIHDGSDDVEAEFAKYGERPNGYRINPSTNKTTWYGAKDGSHIEGQRGYEDKGTASRFFYCAKASKSERNGSKHPTVKPLALMRYLCRLITPPGGTVLDPFAGTGTTGQAAIEEGFEPILIEREAEYIQDIKKRLDVSSRVTQEQNENETLPLF